MAASTFMLDEEVETPRFGDPFVDVFVEDTPVTQGSVSHGNGNTYNEHHDELLWWRKRIEMMVRRSRGRQAKVCIEGPVVVSMSIFISRGDHPLWRAFPIGREAGGTDLDKLIRAICDGFARTTFYVKSGKAKGTKVTRGAEAISDDGNIVASSAMKLFTHRDLQPEPGLRLKVWQVDRDVERAGWAPVSAWPTWRYVRRDSLYMQ